MRSPVGAPVRMGKVASTVEQRPVVDDRKGRSRCVQPARKDRQMCVVDLCGVVVACCWQGGKKDAVAGVWCNKPTRESTDQVKSGGGGWLQL